MLVVSACEDINLHKNVHSIFEYRGSAVLLVVIINLMKFLDYVHKTANSSADESHFTTTVVFVLVMCFQCFIRVRQGTYYTAHGLFPASLLLQHSFLPVQHKELWSRLCSHHQDTLRSGSIAPLILGSKWSAYCHWLNYACGKALRYILKGRMEEFYKVLNDLQKTKTC